MLRPEYLSRKLTSPLPTKDGGTLRTIGEACEYMAAIGKERERRLHWQRVREVMLQEADEAAVTSRVQLAVLKDAKLDVTALSEPIERMIGEAPPGLLSNAELNVMEEDEQPTELTESNERSDSDSRDTWPKKNRPKPKGQPRMSIAERKNSSRPKPKGHPSRSVAERKNSSRPKPKGQPSRSVAER